MERGLKDYALLMLKGVGMGAADVVPGVSGGTIAFIVGIYDELIDSIKSINGKSLKLFFTGKWGAFCAIIKIDEIGLETLFRIDVFFIACSVKVADIKLSQFFQAKSPDGDMMYFHAI